MVKSVFSASKQIAGVFLQDRRTAFKNVVMFEYPRKDIWALGFVTHDDPNLDLINIFLPTTPNPTSGYILMLPREDTIVLTMNIEEGIRLIISGGSVLEEEMMQHPAVADLISPDPLQSLHGIDSR